MKKKPVRAIAKLKSMTSDDHRKIAGMHRAKSHLHEAKADLLEVQAPAKPTKGGRGKVVIRPY